MEGLSDSVTIDSASRSTARSPQRPRCPFCGTHFDQHRGRPRGSCYALECAKQLQRERNRAKDRRRCLLLYGVDPPAGICTLCFYPNARCKCTKGGA